MSSTYTEKPEFEVGTYKFTVTNSGERRIKFEAAIFQYVHEPRYKMYNHYNSPKYWSKSMDEYVYYWRRVTNRCRLRSKRQAERWANSEIKKRQTPLPIPKLKKVKESKKFVPTTETHYV